MLGGMLALAEWLQWVVAVGLFLVIMWIGGTFLRGVGRTRPKEHVEPEEVSGLAVFLVCGECGTEFQVTKLGEIQIPRHCGEPMQVTRRVRGQPQSN